METIRTLLLSGAVLAVAAQAGQTFNVHFPFRTPAGDLPAGQYRAEVEQSAGASYLKLINANTRTAVLLYPTSPVISNRGTEQPRMEFTCGAAGCDLKRLWRDSMTGMEFRQRKLTAAEKERVSAVRSEVVPAE